MDRCPPASHTSKKVPAALSSYPGFRWDKSENIFAKKPKLQVIFIILLLYNAL
jgi:hypothetical protein